MKPNAHGKYLGNTATQANGPRTARREDRLVDHRLCAKLETERTCGA